MSPRRQLTIANALMGIGLLPFAFTVSWSMAFILTTSPGRPPVVPIIDPLGMIGMIAASFFLSLAIAGLGAVWSMQLTDDHGELRTSSTLAFRRVTAIVLLGTYALSCVLSLFREALALLGF